MLKKKLPPLKQQSKLMENLKEQITKIGSASSHNIPIKISCIFQMKLQIKKSRNWSSWTEYYQWRMWTSAGYTAGCCDLVKASRALCSYSSKRVSCKLRSFVITEHQSINEKADLKSKKGALSLTFTEMQHLISLPNL